MVSATEFVSVYMQKRDVSEVGETLNTSEQAVRNRVNYYRKRGVKLPVARGRKGLNIDALNKLVKSYK